MNNNVFSVQNIIERIDHKEILLPAMQRKYVWDEERIVCFFDSLLKDFPFGVFIFWNIDNINGENNYRFYQFIKNYSNRNNTINEQAGKIIRNRIDLVLDGQQRLTSLYIGIKGSIETRIKWKRKDSSESWEKKHLYIKPFIPEEERDENSNSFVFCFLTDDFVEEWNKKHIDYERYYRVSEYYGLSQKQLYDKLGVKRIRTSNTNKNWMLTLEKLRKTLNEDKIIHIQSVKDLEILDVLEVFRRINSSGKPLSPAQLLFSTLITSWEEGRDKIDDYITSINKENVFCLREDTLIRICLYLLNKPLKAKLGVLTKDTVDLIKDNWINIERAITATKEFLKKNNIFEKAIVSSNAIMPIVYYFYNIQQIDITNAEITESEKQLMVYFAISQLFSLFGGNSTETLDIIRKKMCESDERGKVIIPFSVKNLFDINLSSNRFNAFRITEEQIEKLVDNMQYGDKRQYMLLCLLQPEIKICSDANDYDVDHICSKNELKKLFKGIRGKRREILENQKNSIVNLQLLQYNENREDKKSDSLYTWVVEKHNKIPHDPFVEKSDENYKLQSIEDFEKFYTERRNILVDVLCEKLIVNEESN